MTPEQPTDDPYRFPDLAVADRVHLQRLETRHGRERVLGWLRAKIAVPLRYQFAEDFDEDAYYEAMRTQYVTTECDRNTGATDDN